MSRHPDFVPQGVIPAVLVPSHEDLSSDEASFRAHLRDVAAVQGLSAITINAHSTEVASCAEHKQRRVMEIAAEEVGGALPIIHGVYADGSLEAARIARQAQAGGASALLVFPPGPFTLGQSAEMALAHFKTIAEATDLPLIVFQYPLAIGQGYPAATLERLFDEVPTIRAINVLSTNSAWLLSALVLGCNGLLSGSGSVIADLQARLYRAVAANDLAEARRLNDRIQPLMSVFYADPFVDMHNRMKEALVILRRLPRAVLRPPLVNIGDAEVV